MPCYILIYPYFITYRFLEIGAHFLLYTVCICGLTLLPFTLSSNQSDHNGPARNFRQYTGINLNSTVPPSTWSPSHIERGETIKFPWKTQLGSRCRGNAQCGALREITGDTLVSTLTRRGRHYRDRLVTLRREKQCYFLEKTRRISEVRTGHMHDWRDSQAL